MSALAGLRVVELSREVPAAYCARQFALWGADVVTLEPEGGSPLRRLQPLVRDAEGGESSLVWVYTAAGKRAMNLAALGEGAAAWSGLLARSDVLITDYDARALAGLGATLEGWACDHPHLCIVALSPFGRDGPYADHASSALIAEALSGYLALNGERGAPPLRAPGRLTSYAVGVTAFVGALAAYLKRLRTGWGDLVEVSEMEALATIVPFLRVQYVAEDKVREGGTEAGVRVLPCSDGWVSLLPLSAAQKAIFAEALDIPPDDIPADLYDGAYHEALPRAVAFFSRYTRRKTADEVFFGLESRGVTCGKVLSPRELLGNEQLQARGFFRTLTDPRLGRLSFAGPAARLKETRPAPPRPAPQPGERAGLAELGWETLRATSPEVADRGRPPLEGVRVLDLTQAWIGPFATLLFADLGAEVIKIESHRRPDVWRQASPQPTAIKDVRAERVNRSYYFNSVNRNKRNLALDLRAPEGRDLFLRLLETADIVAENYTAHVMERFGLDYEALRAVRSDVVMMSSSGFGKTGPWSDFKTNGSAVEGLAGWDWFHRYAGGEPVLMGFYQADAICGLQMAALTLLSLATREQTGRGEFIDGAMMEAAAGYVGDLLLAAQLGLPDALDGNRSPDMAPHGVFPCRGDDRWIAISVIDDAAWRRLAEMAGAPVAIGAPAYDRLEGRRADEARLEAALADWTATWDADALMAALQTRRVAAGVVRGAREALDEPHLCARDWFKPMTHPDLGSHKYNGFPWRFANCELRAVLPPPRLGEHSELLLRELLSLTDEEIARLKAKDITGAVL